MKKLNIIVLLILTFLISCNKNDTKIQTNIDNLNFFQPAELGAFGSKTRFIIYAYFDECGEWRGHEETFEIFSKEDKKFYARYIRTKVDCQKVGEFYGTPEFQQPNIESEFKLTENNIIEINNYLSKLLKSKISERFPGHAGQTFGAMKSDSTLIINVYDSNKENLINYNTLLKSFNIEEVNYEYR